MNIFHKPATYFLLTPHTHSINIITITMDQNTKTQKLTPQQEEAKQKTKMFMEMEALGPDRIKRISTTDYKTKSTYVPGATLRLRDLKNLENKGSLTADQIEGVKEWRCKCLIEMNSTRTDGLL